eukprot:TRINITY_DN2111_c0_g1_i2.p1 TRINITY_DN2111_c0_g1~~TRINITY_DN2111_c0_g1_i2.p1  ORF type:complete len:657 (-),score=99.69 TRINITY_DN2111_c0_g1_i2:381-2351(-)
MTALASLFISLAALLEIRTLHCAQLSYRPSLGRSPVSKHRQKKWSAGQSNGTLFTDISARTFPSEWYTWNHVGFPRRYAGTPVFADLNNDGVLDFFYHNHYQMLPQTDWDVGVSAAIDANDMKYSSVGEQLILSTEIPDTNWTELPIDSHGTAILDIDRDGLLDMYIATGGGMGMESGPAKNAIVLWGEPSNASVHGVEQIFKGGRETSEMYDLHNPDSRGRFTYFADFNKDGLLDMVFSNEVRVDDINAFGYALINTGNRSFKKHFELSEYASTMVLTDADHDGRADELVIQRGGCLPMDDPEFGVEAAEPNFEHIQFCETRPQGSTAIYKYDPATDGMVLISQSVSRTIDGDRRIAMSMQSADFDGDLQPDLAVLYDKHIHFFLSTERRGRLPMGDPDAVIRWEVWTGDTPCSGRALRVADMNLDGEQEIIVMCAQPGHHLLFQRNVTGGWELGDMHAGDLHETEKPLLHRTQLASVCGKDPPLYVTEFCSALSANEQLPWASTYGMALVDWNNDGFMDITVTHDVGALMMLRNDWSKRQTDRHKFFALKLQGVASNAYGIGATVLLTARNVGRKAETVTQLREINSASHETDWWGSKDDRIVFGLGSVGVPERLEIRWPGRGRHVQIIDDEQLLMQHTNSMTNLLHVVEPQQS